MRRSAQHGALPGAPRTRRTVRTMHGALLGAHQGARTLTGCAQPERSTERSLPIGARSRSRSRSALTTMLRAPWPVARNVD